MSEKVTWDEFIASIQRIESEAHQLGLHATAHAINEAKNKAGFEYADLLARLSQKEAS